MLISRNVPHDSTTLSKAPTPVMPEIRELCGAETAALAKSAKEMLQERPLGKVINDVRKDTSELLA